MSLRIRHLALWFACLLIVTGCSKPAGEGAPKASAARVKLALNWVPEPEFGGFYAARDGGAFAKHGLEVEIQGGGAGVPVVQMVATGKAEFGIAGADEVITARARGADVVPIFAVYQTSPQGIMAHASRGAKSIPDLMKSGTLAMEPGLPYAAFLRMKHGGIQAKMVPYDGGVARFLTDPEYAQQCFVTSEPIAAKRKGAAPTVFLIADEGFNPYTAVVITSRALWKEKPETVRAFVRATRDGWRAYLDNPGPANAAMGKLNTAMDAETFALAAAAQAPLIETDETKKRGLGTMSRERWETLARQLVDLAIIGRAPAIDEYLIALE